MTRSSDPSRSAGRLLVLALLFLAPTGHAQESTRVVEARTRRERLERANERTSVVQWLDGHTSEMLGIRFSPDGERAATWGSDGAAWLWDAWTGEVLGRLGVHEEVGVRLAFSPDGERIVILDPRAGAVSIWDGRSAEYLGPIELETQIVNAFAFARDGRLVTADEDGRVIVWDAQVGEPLEEPFDVGSAVRSIQFHPDGETLLALLVDGTARVLDARSGERAAELAAPHAPLTWVSFSASGERVLGDVRRRIALCWTVGEYGPPTVRSAVDLGARYVDWGRGALATHDDVRTHRRAPPGNRIFVWASEGEASLLDPDTAEETKLDGFPQGLAWAGFAPDGERLLTLHGETGRLWDARTGEAIAELSGKEVPFYATVAVFSDDGSGFAVGRWATMFGTPMFTAAFDGRSGELVGETRVWTAGNYDMCFDPDGRRVAVATELGEGWIFSLDRWVRLAAHAYTVGAVVSADRGFAVPFICPNSGAQTTPLRVWDLGTGRDAFEARSSGEGNPGHAVFHPTEPWLFRSMWAEPSEWTLLDLPTGEVLETVPLEFSEGGRSWYPNMNPVLGPRASSVVYRRWDEAHSGELWRRDGDTANRTLVLEDIGELPNSDDDELARLVLFDPNGELLFVGHDDGTVRIRDVATGELVGEMQTGSGRIADLAVSPEGALLACYGDAGAVELWDYFSLQRTRRIPIGAPGLGYVELDSAGERLLCASADGVARVFPVSGEGEPLVLAGHAAQLRRAVFGPEDRRILTVSEDGSAAVWDAATGAELAVLEGHTGGVFRGEFLDDERVLTCGWDATVRIWKADGTLLATRAEYKRDGWIVFTPDGYYLDSGRAAELARIEVRGATYPLSSYEKIFRDPAKVELSLKGEAVKKPAFVPRAPELELVAPVSGASNERRVSLEALINDAYGVERVVVEQDGRPLAAERVEAGLAWEERGRKVRLALTLSIPEDATFTTFRVRATNVRGIRSAVKTAYVRYEAPKSDLYVFALGVADYEDDDLDLAYPTKDVLDLTTRLREEEGGLYRKVLVRTLLDREVRSGRLRRIREEFLLQAKPDDTIIVFAAGHGVRSSSGEYYYLTPDATPESPYDGIDRSDLESLVTWDKLHARRRMLLIDTCHSGEELGSRGKHPDTFRQEEVDAALGSGLYIIAASSERDFAREQAGNGLFTRALIDGLDGAADRNEDGLVDVHELVGYTSDRVHEESGGLQRPTVPLVEGGEAFAVARARRR